MGLLELAHCGATVCDVIGDLFDPQHGEMTTSPVAVNKQMALIEPPHGTYAEVLSSSHVLKYSPMDIDFPLDEEVK